MAPDPAFKGDQRWSCGNSFRESVSLMDGAGEESLLSILGSVQGHIKSAGVGQAVAVRLAPGSWHVRGVYLQQTMPEFVQRALSSFLPS